MVRFSVCQAAVWWHVNCALAIPDETCKGATPETTSEEVSLLQGVGIVRRSGSTRATATVEAAQPAPTLTVADGPDCPEGYEQILDKTECQNAAGTLHDSSYYGDRWFRRAQYGCIGGGGRIFWNNVNQGRTDRYHRGRRGVCSRVAEPVSAAAEEAAAQAAEAQAAAQAAQEAAQAAEAAAEQAAQAAAAGQAAQTGADTQSPETGSEELEQFTPDPADWSTFQSKVEQVSSVTSHDPDGVTWIRRENWQAAEWDGTIYNPSEMSRSELSQAICPSGDIIRGIREVFYRHRPFADNNNPTKAEVDEWHRIAINHIRALVGYTDPDRQVQKDHCMFARALWQQQRQRSTQWDEDYPSTDGRVDTAAGPCTGGTNPHCGASFLPSAEDQAEFLPPGHAACVRQQGAEGIFSAPKSNIPWSIKWSRAFCSTLGSEGFWGGHTGPFFHRERFGFSFWDLEPGNLRSNAVLTGKWTGRLMPSLYEQPSR